MLTKLFFIIYNTYYRNGNFKNDIPPLTVGGIFLIFFFCTGMSIHATLRLLEINSLASTDVMSPRFATVIVLGSVVTTYTLFFMNKKYTIIYEKFKDDIFLNSFFGKVLGFLIVILGIILPFVLAYIRLKYKPD